MSYLIAPGVARDLPRHAAPPAVAAERSARAAAALSANCSARGRRSCTRTWPRPALLGRLAAARLQPDARPRAARAGRSTPTTATCSRDISAPLMTRVFIALERLLARVSDAIVAISPAIERELRDGFRIGRAEQYRVVPLGFDLSAVRRDRRRGARRRARRDLDLAGRCRCRQHRRPPDGDQAAPPVPRRRSRASRTRGRSCVALDRRRRRAARRSRSVCAAARHRRSRALPRLAPRSGDHLRRHRCVPADVAKRRHAGRADRSDGVGRSRRQHRRRRRQGRDRFRPRSAPAFRRRCGTASPRTSLRYLADPDLRRQSGHARAAPPCSIATASIGWSATSPRSIATCWRVSTIISS